MKILYFAWLKDKTGIEKEIINSSSIKDTNSLLNFIRKKNPKLKRFIDKKNILRIAVNHKYVFKNTKLIKSDEIAIFPPVSGG